MSINLFNEEFKEAFDDLKEELKQIGDEFLDQMLDALNELKPDEQTENNQQPKSKGD